MGRAPCCEKNGLKKGPWTPEEDKLLIEYIHKNGSGNWRTLPNNAGLQRCGKSCRLRWTNYLRPDIKRGRFSIEEEAAIIHLHTILGNKWSAIAAHLPGRTDNEIKNYWNTHVRKRLMRMGIDPVTHNFRPDLLDLSRDQSRLWGLLRTHNYPDLMRLASSFLHYSYSQNLQLMNNEQPQIQSDQFQDFAIPATFPDHQHDRFGNFVADSLFTEDYSLPMANYDFDGSGQPVVDPFEFQSDSSSSFSLQSVLTNISSPTTMKF